jgi:Domain of unknown function (DUF4328)/Protein of unknown function (DUF2510)
VPTPDWWRPTRSLATWLTGLFAVEAVLRLVNVFTVDNADVYVRWHDAFDALLDGRNATAQRIFDDNPTASGGWSSVAGMLGIATLVLLIVWTWRSAHNARALGRTGARLAPGWAIGAWFVPLANVVLVYILVSDLWRSSDPDVAPGEGWRGLPGSALVRLWVVAYTGGVVLLFAAIGLAVTGVTGVETTRALLTVGGVVGAAGTGLAILVVREITDRQEALQARDPAPTERPIPRQLAAPATVDAPGWYADPSGQHDHRYWDGRAWTEHVSRGGVAGTAPVVPADWYPDPTGRFHWRYWTGSEWTEHVSRDQELFLDPIDPIDSID